MMRQTGLRRLDEALRQYGESARRKSETIAHFRPAHHDQGAGRRHPVEVGHDFDLKVAVL